MSNKDTVGDVHFKNIPRDLKRQYRAWCTRNGTNMRLEFVKLIRKTLSDDRKAKKLLEEVTRKNAGPQGK